MLRDAKGYFEKKKTEKIKGVFLGDSITAGGGTSVSSKFGFAYRTAAMLTDTFGKNIEMHNHGYGGYSVFMLLNEIVDLHIINKNYDLIIVEAGTNDWNYATDRTRFEADYNHLIKILYTKTNAQIVCLGLGWFDKWPSPVQNQINESEYNDIIRKICEDYGVGYIDIKSAMINSALSFEDMTYEPDRVHPNDAGAEIWAKELYAWLTAKS